ncbi:zinc finger protein 180-like isoform X2 [Achroia grisella]|uniref:zinc finger protein 180-like isoform X2 n=1 Tax=Achroia grisella TaxID=688607 RepID=UPI0027D20615|nr:zinc finger protein 180-like isoform X2 [Achroia grisella]
MCLSHCTDKRFDNIVNKYLKITIFIKTIYDFCLFKFVESIASDFICEKCTESAIICYKFIKTCQNNIHHIESAINSLNECFAVKTVLQMDKDMIAVLNLNDFTTKQYYDREIKDKLLVFQHMQTVSNHTSSKLKCFSNNETEIENYVENIIEDINYTSKSEGSNKSHPISIKGMMCENNASIYKCKECSKTFLRSHNLKQHYMRAHAPKTYKCNNCHKYFGSVTILNQHMNESHYNRICTQCGKTFNNITSLKVHEVSHTLKFECHNCGKCYKSMHTFKNHMKLKVCKKLNRKLTEPKLICDFCSKKYSNKQTLVVHIKIEHEKGKAHVCSWCDKRFSAESRLKAHTVTHTGEKNYSCDLCHRRFVTKESLLIHTRTHTGEKPYECEKCKQRFITSSRRAEHVRREHTESMQECDICNSKFKTRACLLQHRKRHINPNSRFYLKLHN